MPRKTSTSRVRTIILTPLEKAQLKMSGLQSQSKRRKTRARRSTNKLRIPSDVLSKGRRSRARRGYMGGSKRRPKRKSGSKERHSRSKLINRK